VFPSESGARPLDSQNFINRVFRPALHRACITNFSWHDLRHTFASRLSKPLFVLVDTVATRSYSRHENGHGWLGIRFQTQGGGAPSDVLIHVYLLDKDPAREQEALGIVGVNLAHAAFHHHPDPAKLVGSLPDNVERDRVEIDMVKLSGPAFGGFDSRLASLKLVELDFTDAAMLAADGDVVQPSEVLYKRPLLIERGTFRPPTKVTLAVLESARERFSENPTSAPNRWSCWR